MKADEAKKLAEQNRLKKQKAIKKAELDNKKKMKDEAIRAFNYRVKILEKEEIPKAVKHGDTYCNHYIKLYGSWTWRCDNDLYFKLFKEHFEHLGYKISIHRGDTPRVGNDDSGMWGEYIYYRIEWE